MIWIAAYIATAALVYAFLAVWFYADVRRFEAKHTIIPEVIMGFLALVWPVSLPIFLFVALCAGAARLILSPEPPS